MPLCSCGVLHSTLKGEEEEIARIRAEDGAPEWFRKSVIHAPEVAVCYLARKEALRRNLGLHGRYEYIDLCLLNNRVYVATLELKWSHMPQV